MREIISSFIIVSFLVTGQMGTCPVYAENFYLPPLGVMVQLSPSFDPPILKGIKVHPNHPFHFDFILSNVIPAKAGIQNQEQLKIESTKLIKYFLASLTIPEKDLWVNLSPYEKNRIIPPSFGLTEMGRDLLAEDYMLKQITASLMYPENEVGKKFWKQIYEEAQMKFGTTNIPVNTFNKVWIIPDKAVVYENMKAGTAYIVESKLKVMLEQDYLSLEKHMNNNSLPLVGRVREGGNKEQSPPPNLPLQGGGINTLSTQVIRDIIIPDLTKEVNKGKNFAKLRQVYNSLILAAWYKKKIQSNILKQVYADKNKTAGVQYTSSVILESSIVIPAKAGIQNRINSDMDPRFRGDDKKSDVEAIYQQYFKAFKKGVYNYIKEEIDPVTLESVPRKYFSGGVDWENFGNMAMSTSGNLNQISEGLGTTQIVTTDFQVAAPLENASANGFHKTPFIPVAVNHEVEVQRPGLRKVEPSPVVLEFESKIDFQATTYKEYIARLNKKERQKFEGQFMQDFVLALKAYERSGDWQNHHPPVSAFARNNFIELGKRILGEKGRDGADHLYQRGFYDSEEYFYNGLVRRYILAKLISGGPSDHKNGDKVPIYLDLSSTDRMAQMAKTRAQALTKDTVREILGKFFEGEILIPEIPVNKWIRWSFKALKRSPEGLAHHFSLATLGFIAASIARALYHHNMAVFWGGVIFISFITLLKFLDPLREFLWDFILKGYAEKLNVMMEEKEHAYYSHLLRSYVMETESPRMIDKQFRELFEYMRSKLHRVDQYNTIKGRQNRNLFNEVERIILGGLKGQEQCLWVARIGAELVNSQVRADTRTISVAMLKELADQNPKYFNKLINRWQWQQKVKDWVYGQLRLTRKRNSLHDIILDMLPLIRLHQNEEFLNAHAHERTKLKFDQASLPQVDSFGYGVAFDEQLEQLLTTDRFDFDGKFLDYFFAELSQRISNAKDRRSVVLSYFLAGGGARLKHIKENFLKNRPIHQSYSERLNNSARSHWLRVLTKIKEIDPDGDIYGVTDEEIDMIMDRLKGLMVYPETNANGGIDFNMNRLNLQIRNTSLGFRTLLDPMLLEQLKNAPGFVPVIIKIQPVTDLRKFLTLIN